MTDHQGIYHPGDQLPRSCQHLVARVSGDENDPLCQQKHACQSFADPALIYRDISPGKGVQGAPCGSSISKRTLRFGIQSDVAATLPTRRGGASVGEQISQPKLRRQLECWSNPKGPGNNDRTPSERVVNVITSLPFAAVGLSIFRGCKERDSKVYGVSMMAVGLAATAYHSASGRIRTVLRKADHWTISLSTIAMTHCLHPQRMRSKLGRAASACSLAVIPFKPTLVTACHAGLMEVELAKQARRSSGLSRRHRRHAAAGCIGIGCFLLEDVAIKRDVHWVHSLWHCLACYAVSSTNALLKSKECLSESAGFSNLERTGYHRGCRV